MAIKNLPKMKINLPSNPFCLAFGHNYFFRDNSITGKEEIVCKCCESNFRYSLNGNLIEVPAEQYAVESKLRYLKV